MQIKELINKYELEELELTEALKRIQNKDSILFTMSGKMGAGKDTVGDLISDELKTKDYKLINTSFGQLIREEVTDLVEDYNRLEYKGAYAAKVGATIDNLSKLSKLLEDCTVYDRTDEAREALQFWGTEVRRKQDTNYWINKMSQFIVDKVNKGYSVNVTDARFPNEVELVEDLLGKVVRLNVPASVRVERVELRDNIKVNISALEHASETALDAYVFDRVFDGTDEPTLIAKRSLKYIKEDE